MNYKILATSVVITAGVIALALSQASRPPKEIVERITTYDIAEPRTAYGFAEPMASQALQPPPPLEAADAAAAAADAAELAAIPGLAVGVPKIAYRFGYGFRLPSQAIKPLQERHADMCEARGPRRCRILSMKQAENEGDYTYGSLQLAVAADEARAFGKELVGASGKVDGELIASSIDGEDLSKQLVDTEARLRARTVLRDRLLEVLRSRSGTVKELVEAERGVAQVNEEIDEATSWLAEMRARVGYSRMELTYESGAPATGGFAEPVREAWASVGGILGGIAAVLIMLLAVVGPLGVLLFALVWLWRRSGLSMGVGGGWLPPRSEPAEA